MVPSASLNVLVKSSNRKENAFQGGSIIPICLV